MILAEDAVVDIVAAHYVKGHQLQLVFSDGRERIVDFEQFLTSSLNPMIRRYLDLEQFRNFTVENGDLQWNDYDLCFPIADLYEGRI
jgi:hypothetical protein